MKEWSALQLLQSIESYREHLDQNPIYAKINKSSTLRYATECVSYYWRYYFPDEGKEELSTDELQLFKYHPAFVEDLNGLHCFAGHLLIKERK